MMIPDFRVPPLPMDVLRAVFSIWLGQDNAMQARVVCAVWKTAIDDVIKIKWQELKELAPKGPLDLRYLMEHQEKKIGIPTSENAILLFKGINYIFIKYTGGRYSGEVHPRHFQALQLNQYNKLADRGLLSLARRIKYNISHYVGSFACPNRVIEWLNDPQKESCRRTIVGINLCDMGISCIPKEITGFPNLQSLNLNKNNIEALPSFLGEIKSLRTLLVKENRILELPEEFPDWTHLEVIDLSDNNLSTKASKLLADWHENR